MWPKDQVHWYVNKNPKKLCPIYVAIPLSGNINNCIPMRTELRGIRKEERRV
jgi:hypothetical protein